MTGKKAGSHQRKRYGDRTPSKWNPEHHKNGDVGQRYEGGTWQYIGLIGRAKSRQKP